MNPRGGEKENDGKRRRLSLGKKPPSPALPLPLAGEKAGLQPRALPWSDHAPPGVPIAPRPVPSRTAQLKPLCASVDVLESSTPCQLPQSQPGAVVRGPGLTVTSEVARLLVALLPRECLEPQRAFADVDAPTAPALVAPSPPRPPAPPPITQQEAPVQMLMRPAGGRLNADAPTPAAPAAPTAPAASCLCRHGPERVSSSVGAGLLVLGRAADRLPRPNPP